MWWYGKGAGKHSLALWLCIRLSVRLGVWSVCDLHKCFSVCCALLSLGKTARLKGAGGEHSLPSDHLGSENTTVNYALVKNTHTEQNKTKNKKQQHNSLEVGLVKKSRMLWASFLTKTVSLLCWKETWGGFSLIFAENLVMLMEVNADCGSPTGLGLHRVFNSQTVHIEPPTTHPLQVKFFLSWHWFPWFSSPGRLLQ